MTVTVSTNSTMQSQSQQDIESHSSSRHYQHGGVVDLEVLVVDPPDCQVDQDASHVPDDAECGQCSQRLRSVVSVGHPLGGLPLTDVQHRQTHSEAGEVTEHVRGVAHDCQGPAQVSSDHLTSHEHSAQHCSNGQLSPRLAAAVSPGFLAMTVIHQIQFLTGEVIG